MKYKSLVKQQVLANVAEEGLVATCIPGVSLFRVTTAIPCSPAVYEPAVIVILNGTKEAIYDGNRHLYDHNQYLCCSVTLPIETGTPQASEDDPLVGVYISLDTEVMTSLVLALEGGTATTHTESASVGDEHQGIVLADWDDAFAEALYRLLALIGNEMDASVLASSRLREFYYTLLTGDMALPLRRAFGVGNDMGKVIQYLSSRLSETITIEQLAEQVNMSRAVFHRKFKHVTSMSPLQYVKSMRLNTAAMKIAVGESVTQAALGVGYESASQFSRDFKRTFGQSPKRWGQKQREFEQFLS